MASNIEPGRPKVGIPPLTRDAFEDNFQAAKDEIEGLDTRVTALEGGGGGGGVDSFEGRTGAVVATSGDYDDSEVDAAASATNYTPASSDVQGHLSGIDTALGAIANPTESLIIAASDETSDLTTGTAKTTFRMPYAFTLTAVRASVTTAPTGSVLTVDINEGGATILSTKITIDATEKTSTTAATAPVISDSALADDAEMTIDIDTIGSTVAGAGLKVSLIGSQT